MEQSSGDRISDALDESIKTRLDLLEEFSTLASTNSYLLQQAAPLPGRARVAVADQQTAGRGQRGRVWCSPPLAGLYLSVSYTFTSMPNDFSCLTLTSGTAVVKALEGFGAGGIQLKWPNDLILEDGKLGGMLTELKAGNSESPTAVIGLGLNLDMAGQLDGVTAGIGRISDLRQALPKLPDRAKVAAAIVEHLIHALSRFEVDGFNACHALWKQHDWLEGKAVNVATPAGNIEGIAAGVGMDGTLRVKNRHSIEHIVSGTVTLQTPRLVSAALEPAAS